MLLILLACQSQTTATPFNDALDLATETYGVPRELLASIAWSATRFDGRRGSTNLEAGLGVMNLRTNADEPSITTAAELLQEDVEALIDDSANILGAAALLADQADLTLARTGNRVDTWQEWYILTAWYAGTTDPMVAEGFAEQVYDWMQFGILAPTPDGELVEISPVSMPWRRTAVSGSSLVDAFVAASSSNYSDYNRGSGDITSIVVHTVQGSYSGCVNWFQNSAASASAHYVVRSSDGEITQMVQEEDVAWHAGHWDTNLKSIGIEHEGYVEAPETWYTDALYEQSAALARDIADRYGIPKDRDHIFGHRDVPGCSSGNGGGSSCHTDPGDGWDWDRFMTLVNGGTSSTTPSTGSSTDGTRSGSFSGKVTATRYGEMDTCGGPISGAVNNGQLYLTGTCTLNNNPDKSGDVPLTWSGTIAGGTITGRMVVDGRSANFTGAEAADGTVSARFSGSEDLGGDVGELTYEVEFSAAP